jgi:hypothetical protein
VTRSGPLAPTAPALTRQAHAGTLTQYHPSPLIREETIPEYQTALHSLHEELSPVTLPALMGGSSRRMTWTRRRQRTPWSSPRLPRLQQRHLQKQERAHRQLQPQGPHPSQIHLERPRSLPRRRHAWKQ